MYIVRALWGCIVQVCRYYGYDMALRSARTTVKLVVFMVDLLEQNDTEINELVHVLIIRFNTPFSGNSVQVTHRTPTQLQTLVHGQPRQKTTLQRRPIVDCV